MPGPPFQIMPTPDPSFQAAEIERAAMDVPGAEAANVFVCDELSQLAEMLKTKSDVLSSKERELVERERLLEVREGDEAEAIGALAKQREDIEERERQLHLLERQLKEEESQLAEQWRHLEERQRSVEERHRSLAELSLLAASAQDSIAAYMEEQVSRAASASQQTIGDLQSSLHSKEGELERLKHSYEDSRQANHKLRSQLDSLRAGKSVLEKDLKQLQARVASLQVARTIPSLHTSPSHKQHCSSDNVIVTEQPVKAIPRRKPDLEIRDTLITLLIEWLTRVLSECSSTTSQISYSCSRQVLPVLAKVLPQLSPSHHLPFLKLTIWSVFLLHENGVLTSSLRNIGRHILKPPASGTALFMHSSDIYIRTLSSLCLLATLSEEDAHVSALHCLLQDLAIAESQEVFHSFFGTCFLSRVIKPGGGRVTQMAVAILTMLSLNSAEQCSNQHCVEAVCSLLHDPAQLSSETLNNVTITLQRLSENRLCWRYLTSCGALSKLERLRSLSASSSDQHSQFRLRNIQAILKNKPHHFH